MEQDGLYAHWEQIHRGQRQDFRATALNALVANNLDPAEWVLDVGCGACGFVLDMLERGQSCVGLDSSEEMLAMGRYLLVEHGFPADHAIQCELADYSHDARGSVPQAVCLDVIEHIADDATALAQIHALLQPGGRLVLSVPAMPALYGPKDEDLGHYRRYSVATLRGLFDDTMWDVESLRYWNLLGVPFTWFAVKVRRRAVSERVRSGTTKLSRTLSSILRWWFHHVENRIRPPVGLSLVLIAHKRAPSSS